MKRKGYLIEELASWHNLNIAFYMASKGKLLNEDVLSYKKNLSSNLKRLQSQILTGDISVGKYHYFTIYDPKERVICAASFDERVLHHAIMNVCHQFFERTMIYDSYATRPHKGIYKAIDKVYANMRKYRYVAKLDVRKYFDSISHNKLNELLATKFKDKNLLLIFSKIIDSYEVKAGCGVPIGNLTSQYLANFYLSSLDHYVKESLHIPIYVRYMDDMLLLSNSLEGLKNAVDNIRQYLLSLQLVLKPVVLGRTDCGVSFLGYKLFPHKILLNKASKQRFKNKMKNYSANFNKQIWTERQYKEHIVPLLSFASKAYTKNIRKGILVGL